MTASLETGDVYSGVRSLILPGDVVAFAGNSLISKIVQLATRSVVSHCAIVLEIEIEKPERRVMLLEATSLGGYPYAQITPLSFHVDHYDGSLWWLPLSKPVRARFDVSAFEPWALSQVGKPYSFLGSVEVVLDDWFDHHPPEERDDFARLFCSEATASGLEVGGAIEKIDASTLSPKDVLALGIYERAVQLRGDQIDLSV